MSHTSPPTPHPRTQPRTDPSYPSIPTPHLIPASCKPICTCFQLLLRGSWGHFGHRLLFCLLGPGIHFAFGAAICCWLPGVLWGVTNGPIFPLREPKPLPWAGGTHPPWPACPRLQGHPGLKPEGSGYLRGASRQSRPAWASLLVGKEGESSRGDPQADPTLHGALLGKRQVTAPIFHIRKLRGWEAPSTSLASGTRASTCVAQHPCPVGSFWAPKA